MDTWQLDNLDLETAQSPHDPLLQTPEPAADEEDIVQNDPTGDADPAAGPQQEESLPVATLHLLPETIYRLPDCLPSLDHCGTMDISVPDVPKGKVRDKNRL